MARVARATHLERMLSVPAPAAQRERGCLDRQWSDAPIFDMSDDEHQVPHPIETGAALKARCQMRGLQASEALVERLLEPVSARAAMQMEGERWPWQIPPQPPSRCVPDCHGRPSSSKSLEYGAGPSPTGVEATDFQQCAPSSSDYLPERVGPYMLSGRLLGEGGTGNVYHGWCSQTRVEVAIKRLHRTTSHRPPPELEPLRIVAAAGHPNICAFLDHRSADGVDYIVMEYCSGGELFALIDKDSILPEAEAAAIARDAVGGLAFMHRQGVCHRDLKLENILLDRPNGRAKICDFGLAHIFGRDVSDRPIFRYLHRRCGTRSYTAPEVIAEGGYYYDGYTADVWSLGVCIFAMASGFFPLEVAHEKDWRFSRLVAAQLAGFSTVHTIFSFYQRECHFSPPLVEVLDGMLLVDPLRRLKLHQMESCAWLAGPPPLRPPPPACFAAFDDGGWYKGLAPPPLATTVDIDLLEAALSAEAAMAC